MSLAIFLFEQKPEVENVYGENTLKQDTQTLCIEEIAYRIETQQKSQRCAQKSKDERWMIIFPFNGPINMKSCSSVKEFDVQSFDT